MANPPAPEGKRRGKIVTFYSYKGGTGRSLALANVAWLLAANGHNVLAIDWDLEAPGLHRYLVPFLRDPELAETRGVMDLLWDYVNLVLTPRESWPSSVETPTDLADVRPYVVALENPFPDAGYLHFLCAGEQVPAYASRFRDFDWRALYERHGGGTFMDKLAERLRNQYDFVLIDSRTGVADTSGICTVQLPDEVVLCFTYNRQSVKGVVAVAQSIRIQRTPPPLIWPVPMRVEKGVEGLNEARDFAREELDRFLPDDWSADDRAGYWDGCEIAYYPDYAFGETLAVFRDRPQTRNSLVADMRWLASRLVPPDREPKIPSLDPERRDAILRRYRLRGSSSLTTYRESLLRDLSQRYQIDTRFVRLRLLDMVRSEHALQFKEQAKDCTDLREVLAAIPERAMVLLGAPGCGKSTLLRRLQLDDAQDRLDDHGDRVSLFVSLGAYPLDKDSAKDAPRPLDWLNAQWRRQAPDLPDLDTLLREHRVLLLLDALNEMPHRDADDYRDRVEQWRCFLRDDFPPGNQAVFSCRSLDYSETLSVKDDLDVRQVRVQPLTPEQIEEFLRLYAPDHADGAWDEIRHNPRLLELYSTPYFLKLLSDQLAYDPRVVDERAALFTRFVRRALEREIVGRNPLFVQDGVLEARDRDRIAQRSWASAFDLPGRGPLIPWLEALAYAMQEQVGSDGDQVIMPRNQVLTRFRQPRAEALLAAGEQLAVLDEAYGSVRFFHRQLQEYFAARQLRQRPAETARVAASEWRADRIKPSLADKLAALQDFEPLPPPDPTGWEETAVLAAGMATDPDAFALGLTEANLPLAGRCAAALNATDRLKPHTVAELQRRLLDRSRDPDADLRARIAAAHALGELGDPRFERRRGPDGECLLPPMVAIKAGIYHIGSDEGLYVDEAPVHQVKVAAFTIGRFPVTNAEWRCFMEAGGYKEERWWLTDAAKRWRRGEGTAEGPKQGWREFRQVLQGKPERIQQLLREGMITPKQAEDWEYYLSLPDSELEMMLERSYPSGRFTEPAFWNDPPFNHPAHPVTGICWHEARAYCAWLSHQTGLCYRLPMEAEWEAAALGRDGRTYPWGDAFDKARSNTFESHVRGTTPVGVFPGGDTPEGLSDISGNVWEWTGSVFRPYPYLPGDGREDPEVADARRVVRGGSWTDFRLNCRCASRNSPRPSIRLVVIGFRVCCAPGVE